jgi:hypothetical protein
MAGAGKKTFTAGEVLTASDVNTYLMEQSVMYFGGTAARASAIPTPSTGMTSYIGVSGTATIPNLESYTGASWQSLSGMTLLANATVSGAAAVSFVNVFTDAYRDYRIVVSELQTTSVPAELYWNLKSGGTDISSAYAWGYTGVDSVGTNMQSVQSVTQPSAFTGLATSSFANVAFSSGAFDIYSPKLAQRTFAVGAVTGFTTRQYIRNGISWHNGEVAYDGIRFAINTGNMSCRIYVYGLRNS